MQNMLQSFHVAKLPFQMEKEMKKFMIMLIIFMLKSKNQNSLASTVGHSNPAGHAAHIPFPDDAL